MLLANIELYNADMEKRNEKKEAFKNDILQKVEKMFKGRTRQLKMFLREEVARQMEAKLACEKSTDSCETVC